MLVIFDIGVTPCGRREAVHIKIFDSRLYINDLETCSKDCPCRMANTQMLMNPGKRLRNNQLKPITSSRGTKSSSETESSSSSWRTPDIRIPRRSKILDRKMYSVVGQVYWPRRRQTSLRLLITQCFIRVDSFYLAIWFISFSELSSWLVSFLFILRWYLYNIPIGY